LDASGFGTFIGREGDGMRGVFADILQGKNLDRFGIAFLLFFGGVLQNGVVF
jgi:hypothetical protein